MDRTNLRKTVNKGVKLIDEGNSYQAENESMRDTNNISHPSFRNKPKGISNIPFRPNSTTRQISFDSEERHSQRRLDSARIFKKSFGKINFRGATRQDFYSGTGILYKIPTRNQLFRKIMILMHDSGFHNIGIIHSTICANLYHQNQ